MHHMDYRLESLALTLTYWLVCFSTALITRVCGNGHHRLDLCTPSDDSSYIHQLANLISLDVTHRQTLLCCWGFEVNLTTGAKSKTIVETHLS